MFRKGPWSGRRAQRARPGEWFRFASTGDADADYADIWPLALGAMKAAHSGDPEEWARYGKSLKQDIPVDWRIGLLVWVLLRGTVETVHGEQPSAADIDELSLRYAEPFAAATGLSRMYLRDTLCRAYAYKLDSDIAPQASTDAIGLALIGIVEGSRGLQSLWSAFRDWYAVNPDEVNDYAADVEAHVETRLSD